MSGSSATGSIVPFRGPRSGGVDEDASGQRDSGSVACVGGAPALAGKGGRGGVNEDAGGQRDRGSVAGVSVGAGARGEGGGRGGIDEGERATGKLRRDHHARGGRRWCSTASPTSPPAGAASAATARSSRPWCTLLP